MLARLKDMQKAEKLFANWQEAIIWSCLQKVMGAIYTDNLQNPQAAMAILGDFCFLAGEPNKELVLYKPEWCKQNFIIMIPQNVKWEKLITESYGRKAKLVTRYAIKKEEKIFDKNHLQKAVDSLQSEYKIKLMDREWFERCKLNVWSKDLVSQFRDYEMYKKLGIGVVIVKDSILVSGASSYARYRDGIEIEIDTEETFRRKGLAYACGAKLILECLKRGLYPSWDAQNKASVALAEKLGYNCDNAYPAYEIWGY